MPDLPVQPCANAAAIARRLPSGVVVDVQQKPGGGAFLPGWTIAQRQVGVVEMSAVLAWSIARGDHASPFAAKEYHATGPDYAPAAKLRNRKDAQQLTGAVLIRTAPYCL